MDIHMHVDKNTNSTLYVQQTYIILKLCAPKLYKLTSFETKEKTRVFHENIRTHMYIFTRINITTY